jgi:lipopolysaccharide assembly outer membrane protein LptD (OstA)
LIRSNDVILQFPLPHTKIIFKFHLVKQSTYYLFLFIGLFLGGMSDIFAQRVILKDSTQSRVIKSDSITQSQDLQTTVYYSAADSTILDAANQVVHLYGKAKVKYGEISLEANYIRLDWETNEVFAKGTFDSTSHQMEGLPVFTQGGDKYDSDEIRYNFKSKRAAIKGIVTQQGEGYVQGKTVKKDEEENLYIRNAIYTTCNLSHPHFHINASKIKVVGKKEIISGPFHFELNDIPLPIGLPFGFFPYSQPKEAGKSGILFPTYGEEPTGRGFYLREGGYYWAASENIGIRFTGQIYSKGGWGLGANSQYNKRYRYAGSFNLAFNRNSNGAEFNPTKRTDFALQWSHSPRSIGNSSFSASVNIASNSYNQFNTYSTQQYLSNTIGSSVQYTKNIGQIIRSGVSLRINQNTTTRVFDAGTEFNFGLNQFQPFKRKNAIGDRFMDQFRLGLDFSGSISLTNQVSDPYTRYEFDVYPRETNSQRGIIQKPFLPTSADDLPPGVVPVNASTIPMLWEKAQTKFQYSVPLSLPNIKITPYINLTPGVSLSGNMYTRSYKYTYMPVDSTVRIDTVGGLPKFNSQLSFSASMNTRMYGTARFNKGRVEALRHTMVPSISLSYAPDVSDPSLGYFQDVRINNRKFINTSGVEQIGDIRRISSYDPRTLSYGGATGAISFGLQNTLEAKLKTKSDTATKQSEKINLIDNFGINGSYNLLAKEYPLSNLNFNANSRVREFDINVGGSIDPYLYVQDKSFFDMGRRTTDLMFSKGEGLGRLQGFNLSVGRRFAPSKTKEKTSKEGTESQLRQINRNMDDYVDWNVPWTFSFSYQFSYSRMGLAAAQKIAGLTFQGELSLSEKWKFSVSSGYDFKFNGMTYTNMSVHRDLHCWEMNFNWTPIASPFYGRASNYSFDLRVKSSLLQDLKLSRRRSFYDKGGF